MSAFPQDPGGQIFKQTKLFKVLMRVQPEGHIGACVPQVAFALLGKEKKTKDKKRNVLSKNFLTIHLTISQGGMEKPPKRV